MVCVCGVCVCGVCVMCVCVCVVSGKQERSSTQTVNSLKMVY